jgi:site-specific DNA-methyltransferase (adenine-specific)
MQVKISAVKANKNNPRQIKDDKFKKLVQSIREFPEMLEKRPLVCFTDVDGKYVVLGGNMRLKASQEVGLKEIPIVLADDWTQEQRDEFLVKDNVGFGEWDWDQLANEWDAELLDKWGLDVPNFDTEVLEAEEDDFDTTPPEEPITVLGDLYEIGDHRLLCGDSTDSDQVAKLMNNQKADMVFTDPPYGIGFEYNSHKDKKGAEYLKFCDEWFNNLQIVSDFIFISTGWAYQKFWWNKDPKDCFYWLSKNKRTGGSVSHFRKVEPLFIWGKPKNRYNFDFFEQVTEIINDLKGLHSCPKPITLISDIIKAVNEKDLICDIFLGSGTTMVAAHQINRKCYGMELDPKYCDVIVNRMIALDPSIEIKLNGKPFEKAH